MKRPVEIMDTTLRDGEQTSGVSFSAPEKLTLAKLLLEELRVNRLEVASARVSEGEFQAVKNITKWAAENGYHDRIEVLTFVDGGTSLKWMQKAGARVQNLLTKGSLNHLTHQLQKKPQPPQGFRHQTLVYPKNQMPIKKTLHKKCPRIHKQNKKYTLNPPPHQQN